MALPFEKRGGGAPYRQDLPPPGGFRPVE